MGTTTTTTTKTPHIPHIQLLCMDPKYLTAFQSAVQKHSLPRRIHITAHDTALSQLPSTVHFDTIVSPANSYGRLDGAFDDAISRALSPADDYLALTRAAQSQLYRARRGFAAPGTCTLVRIPGHFRDRSRRGRDWGGAVRHLALCPTMRTPADANWDREVVYECVWNLLCEVDNHNRALLLRREAGGDKKDQDKDKEKEKEKEIRSVLMTPLATGVGRVSPERWAAQTVLALKHFLQASEDPDKWSRLDWGDFGVSAAEVESTWRREQA
ncbi:hypothetical protein F4778DRAFT_374614 [Xylariomycetidae sp. FL2044]|nr:hypothetical protein F4778DRAFT_374614 [Xylariomycetidae sp. FL2044]